MPVTTNGIGENNSVDEWYKPNKHSCILIYSQNISIERNIFSRTRHMVAFTALCYSYDDLCRSKSCSKISHIYDVKGEYFHKRYQHEFFAVSSRTLHWMTLIIITRAKNKSNTVIILLSRAHVILYVLLYHQNRFQRKMNLVGRDLFINYACPSIVLAF